MDYGWIDGEKLKHVTCVLRRSYRWKNSYVGGKEGSICRERRPYVERRGVLRKKESSVECHQEPNEREAVKDAKIVCASEEEPELNLCRRRGTFGGIIFPCGSRRR